MRWDQGHESNDVEDRRGQGGGGGGIGLGALALLPLVKSRWGWGGVLVAVALFFIVPRVLHMGDEPTQKASSTQTTGDTSAHFAAFVLDDAQNVWKAQFAARGRDYKPTKLVLYTDSTDTGCGYGEAATGPFYCPRDARVYLDLGFFNQLSGKLKANGDFAQAYVIAHEIGHHVQNQLGNMESKKSLGAEGTSVRTELQADCFAGVWAHDTNQRNLLEQGDVGEAMTAAAAVGDDRLQKAARGTVRPDSFSHGTSAQRQKWFQRGFDQGKIEACDTFSATDL